MKKDYDLCVRIIRQMVRVVDKTPVDENPCQHAILQDLFPQDVYEDMLQNLPAKEAYRPMALHLFHDSNGVSTRDLIELPEVGVPRMAPDIQALWWAVGTALASEEVKAAIFEKLAEDLAPALGCTPSEVNDQDVFVSVALRTETKSYYMPPHCDGHPRVATMLLYLPEDNSLDGLGTSLYDYAPKWQRPFRAAHREIRRAPFRPNMGVYFSGSKRRVRPGWHGFERPEKMVGDMLRVSLLVAWYTNDPEHHRPFPEIMPVAPQLAHGSSRPG